MPSYPRRASRCRRGAAGRSDLAARGDRGGAALPIALSSAGPTNGDRGEHRGDTRSPPIRSSSCGSRRRTGTVRSSRTRTGSTSTGHPTRTSRSGTASTSVSERRWPGWRPRSRSASCSNGTGRSPSLATSPCSSTTRGRSSAPSGCPCTSSPHGGLTTHRWAFLGDHDEVRAARETVVVSRLPRAVCSST